MKYTVVVEERYPDGSKWVHYFDSINTANEAVALNREAHPARTYEVKEYSNV